MNLLDLFCGCGGLSEGFRLAGYKIIGGIDINEDSIKTYAHNFPKAITICEDLLNFKDRYISDVFGNKNIDIIVGGPPCQGFSNANRWQKESKDPRNKLFYEYLRFVKVLKPKVVVIENVRGILTKDHGYAKNRILKLIRSLGYRVNCEVLNASDFGVPQNRTRAFFVAIRDDLCTTEFNFSELKKLPTVNVKDAIGELYKFENLKNKVITLTSNSTTSYRKYLRSKKGLVTNHQIVYPAEITQKRIKYVPQGGNWSDIPKYMFKNVRENRHSSAFKRLSEIECSVTIDTGNAHSNYFHPLFHRIPTVREAARIQSFNDDFNFLGSRSSQYRQVGNAVPPLLAKALAQIIKRTLKRNENN